jgi:hypothetical protein
MLSGAQPPLGLEPILFGPAFGPAAFFPKAICERPLFFYVELRAHES